MDIISYALSKGNTQKAVTDYLDEHLTNPTNPPIDTSLSIAGAAADSKETGDRIGALKEGLTQIEESVDRKLNLIWTDGKLINANNGNLATSSAFACTEGYYPIYKGQTLNVYAYAMGSGECAVAFYDTSKTFLGYEKSGYALSKFVVQNDGYARFTTRKSVISTSDAFVVCAYDPVRFGTVYGIEDNIADVASDLAKVSDIPANLFKTSGVVIATAINSSNVLNSNQACRTVYIPCLPNTKYIVKKTAGTRFVVASSASVPVAGGSVTNPTTDNSASTIEYTTDATANYLCAWAWYSSDSTNMWDMLASVEIRLATTPTAIDRIARSNIQNSASAANYIKYKKRVDGENKIYVQREFDLTASNFTAGHATISNDGASLELVCNADGSASHQAYLNLSSSPIDLTRACIGVDFDVIEGTSGDTDYFDEISEINLLLSSASSFGSDSDVARYLLIANGVHILYAGNYKVTAFLDIQRTGSNVDVDLSAVKMIGIRVSTKSPYTGTPKIKVNKLFAYGVNQRKQVAIGFDGGSKPQLSALEYLDSVGLSATVFATKERVGTDDTQYMTFSDLVNLQNSGHLIANYCAGSGYWYTLTLVQKKAVIKANAEWLYEHGFGEGAKCVSVPGGGYASDEAELYTQGYAKILTGRIVPSGQPRPSGFYDGNPYGHSSGPNGTNEARIACINSMLKYGGVCVFIFHRCIGAEDDITLDTFKEFADYLAEKSNAGLLEVVTFDKLATDYTLSKNVV